MPTCSRCDRRLSAEELVRHERPRMVVVHCPECKAVLGRYRSHGDRTDG